MNKKLEIYVDDFQINLYGRIVVWLNIKFPDENPYRKKVELG